MQSWKRLKPSVQDDTDSHTESNISDCEYDDHDGQTHNLQSHCSLGFTTTII